jgi:hypothetical protein
MVGRNEVSIRLAMRHRWCHVTGLICYVIGQSNKQVSEAAPSRLDRDSIVLKAMGCVKSEHILLFLITMSTILSPDSRSSPLGIIVFTDD